ncbi:hypothetical protein J7M28_13335 [bacterium]|nr:hypothetical protein [bacterium]
MRTSIYLGIVAILALTGAGFADEIIVEFTASEYEIVDVENGEIIEMDGYGLAGTPGSPMLPINVYHVALPPDVVWDSISIEELERGESALPGQFDIAPHPPLMVPGPDGEFTEDWQGATNVMDGKDVDVYSSDEFLPEDTIKSNGTGQMRKWKYVRIAYAPFSYNPISRQLLFRDGVRLRIEFERDSDLLDKASLNDMVFDDKAATRFVNYREAREWYKLTNGFRPMGDSYDYVIMTTEAIKNGSTELANLNTHLQNVGHIVLTVTESHSYEDGDTAGGYGTKTGQAPDGVADKMRKWLIDYYQNYGVVYVLFIGDPDPGHSYVPMKNTYPGYGLTVPTDYYFADLTGDWDSDGDQYFGEYGQDNADLDPEIYPARIPVYGTDYTNLDNIIQKEINYDTEHGDLDWRLSVLFPLSFPWTSTDPSYYARDMINQYLSTRNFTTYKMYQNAHDNCRSDYAWDEVLHGGISAAGSVVDRWAAHAYGLVFWFGHGNHSVAVVGHGSPAACSEGYLFKTSYCSNLDDTHPAFTFQISCQNGWPSDANNLGYALLKKGAVNTSSASNSSLGYSGNFTYTRRWGGSQDIGYWYARNLTDYSSANGACARAFYEANYYLSTYHSSSAAWHNYFVYNLYGCPHTRIIGELNTYIRLSSFEAHARAGKIVLTWETGAEVDNSGFVIYRFDGKERKAISRLIGAQGAPGAGASYRFVDSNVRPGVRYQYWLVDIDTNGKWTAHGPVGAGLPSPVERHFRPMREARVVR